MGYATVTQANEYLNKRAFTSAWQALPDEEKEGYLNLASELIFQYCFFIDENDFSFRYDTEEKENSLPIPDFLVKATAEQALYLVNLGKDPTQADKKTTLGIASTEGTVFDKGFKADILCVNCRNILEANGGEVSSDALSSGNVSWGYIRK